MRRAPRVNLITDPLAAIDYKGKDSSVLLPNPDVVFGYSEGYAKALAH